VVGGKVVGGFQRFINEGAYKSNIRGTKAEKMDVSEKMKEISINATDAVGYEVSGVDLFEHNGELYIIEVNVTPQWEKFKAVTGINPAKHIVEYAISKYEQR
jgi:ribosomal protein S6--L-glutamate ligase